MSDKNLILDPFAGSVLFIAQAFGAYKLFFV